MSLFDNNPERTIFTIGVDETSSYYLQQTVRWTKFLSIIGFIVIGIMVLAIIPFVFMSASFSALSRMSGAAMPLGLTVFIFFLILFLYIYPTLSLMRFSNYMKTAILSADQVAFSTALRHQRNLYRYLGILMIIVISFYALIFLVGMLSLF